MFNKMEFHREWMFIIYPIPVRIRMSVAHPILWFWYVTEY
jgi:hypothetical protein